MFVPIEFLAECFVYDAESGDLRWKARPRTHFSAKERWTQWNTRHAGSIAGADGRTTIVVNLTYAGKKRSLKAHHIAFALARGYWPVRVDHIDRNPLNNRLLNLREATHAENMQNQKKYIDNTSGFSGVSATRGRWRARITLNQVCIFIGVFDTREEAYTRYRLAKYELHPFATV